MWRALTDAGEFGEWFGVKLKGSFAPGSRLTGKIAHKGYEHVTFEITIERMEPEPLEAARRCLEGISAQWDEALDRLKKSVEG